MCKTSSSRTTPPTSVCHFAQGATTPKAPRVTGTTADDSSLPQRTLQHAVPVCVLLRARVSHAPTPMTRKTFHYDPASDEVVEDGRELREEREREEARQRDILEQQQRAWECEEAEREARRAGPYL